MTSLVQPLFDGPIDIVGDVHGEIEALRQLLPNLGYAPDGTHPEGRRLVFLGDLTDRGRDSPAVVNEVKQLVDSAHAQCVLGNHDLNILLGDEKHDNDWFFGKPSCLDGSRVPTPAVLADEQTRERIRAFFRTLPLVLERPDLRIVHACWQPSMVAIARQAVDTLDLYHLHTDAINARHKNSDLDEIDRGLEHQNLNPVKLLTSGPERRVDPPFMASGKLRHEKRVPWWEDYRDDALCVFGHYSFIKSEPFSSGRAVCIDFGVGKRFEERNKPGFDGTSRAKLAALRFPERILVFDDGARESLEIT